VWQGPIPKNSIYEDYVAWAQKSGKVALPKELFRRVIKKLIVSVEDTRPASGSQQRQRCYKFPSLRQAHEDFSKVFKEKPERIFDNYAPPI
jgi:hypothetical protein